MNTIKTINSFKKQFVAFVKGDDDAALAEKVFRSANAALNAAIATKNADSIELEDKIHNAKEKLASALVNNGKVIENLPEYVKALIVAKNEVTKAEEALELHLAVLEFLKESVSDINSDVEA